MSSDLNSIVPQFKIKMANSRHKTIYEFEDFRLDAGHLLLYQNKQEISLAPKVIETLLVLVERGGEVLSKDELMKLVWTDSIVEEGNLSQNLYLLRKTLGEGKSGKPLIETLRRRGYRFNGEVRRVEEDGEKERQGDAETERRNEGERKINLETDSFSPILPVAPSLRRSVSPSHKVVALADWRRETNGNEAVEQIAVSEPPAVAGGLSVGNNVLPSNSKTRPLPQAVLTVALAAFLIGAIALGYYFYTAKKVAVGDKKSIAILPLKPINAANRDEIYEVGIADSLIIRLSSMKGFVVRPLSATRKYADIEQDALTAGKEQQVDYVLASNYQIVGGKIRVTAQLFNVASGQIEETYKSEKDAADIFVMQDAIAGEIGNSLLARFAVTSSSPTAKRGTTNEEAYRLYLQGRNLTDSRNTTLMQDGAGARKAVEYFEQAIRLDPNYALAYSGMASAFISSGNLGGGLPRVEYEKAKQAVTKALELDNNLAEGYAVSGQLKLFYEWDYAAAEKDLLRAIELEPNSDLAHKQYAFYLAVRGRFDEAIAESKTAQEINPGAFSIQSEYGIILYLARRYDEAILQFTRAIEVNETFANNGYLWLIYEMKGDNAQAYEWFMKGQKARNSEHLALFQNAYETSGWQGVRQKFLELEKLNEQKPSGNYFRLARQCTMLGEKERAFEYLNKAIEKHHGQLITLNVDPSFDALRDDPRFDELVRRIGLK